MTAAIYLYAVCRRTDPPALAGLPGVCPGEPVHVLAAGALAAVVQRVPAEEFAEEAWRLRMADPREVERCALAHDQVVSAVAARGPVAPLALATLYRDAERTVAAVERQADRFASVLDRVTGHTEWGVKVYAAPASAAGAAVPAAAGARPAGPGRDGRAYLERRRAQYRDREQSRQDAVRAAEAVDRILCEVAAAARHLRPRGGPAAGEAGPQLLNAAYLVARDRGAALEAALERARRVPGTRIEVTGPWSPYSFAGLAGLGEGEA